MPKTKMTKTKLGAIKKIAAEIEKKKRHIGILRDELRDYHSDLSDLLSNLDEADEELDQGVELIENGIETLSRLV